MSAQRRQADADLEALCRPVVQRAGFELEAVEVNAAGGRSVVRVIVDLAGGAEVVAGLDLDAVAAITKAISAELDGNPEVVRGSYTLEVTSPGVDRPLTLPRHWRRAESRTVRVRLAGGEELLGRAGRPSAEGVVVLVAGVPRRLRFADIDSATVEVEFAAAPEAELRALADAAAPGEGGSSSEPHGDLAGTASSGAAPVGTGREPK